MRHIIRGCQETQDENTKVSSTGYEEGCLTRGHIFAAFKINGISKKLFKTRIKEIELSNM